jgi:hypothetical protein
MDPRRMARVAVVLSEERSGLSERESLELGTADNFSKIGRGPTVLQSRQPHAEANAALLGDSGNRDDCYDWCYELRIFSVRSGKSVKT